ncbi:MAG TPA: hypothetical protein PLR64_03400 [Candidatus Dojkabacteria bacterium]|nr:hypothetical protein [Candidatus Dojkabacteria bacterium]
MEFRITKIPLEEFLNVLENIYNNGADYIDILSNADGEEGLMKIEVKREYLCPEDEMEGDDMTDDEVMDFYNNLI